MEEEEFFITLISVLSVIVSWISRFLTSIFLLRCVLKHLVLCKCREHRIVEFKFYFCVQKMKVHEDEPVTVFTECEFSPLA